MLYPEVADKVEAIYGHRYAPASEITVPAGATQGILTSVLCCVHPGDEVIVIEPAYDSYVPAIQLAGGVPVFVQMEVTGAGYAVPYSCRKGVCASCEGRLVAGRGRSPVQGAVVAPAERALLCCLRPDTDLVIAPRSIQKRDLVALSTLEASVYRITQPGAYYLTENIQQVPGVTCISIECDGVDLDCQGFAFVGAPAGSPPGRDTCPRQPARRRRLSPPSARRFGQARPRSPATPVPVPQPCAPQSAPMRLRAKGRQHELDS